MVPMVGALGPSLGVSRLRHRGQWLLIALYVTSIAPKLGMKRRDVWLPGDDEATEPGPNSRVEDTISR